MVKIKDKTPRYRVEYYRDDYNSLHQAIQIDLLEELRSGNAYTTFCRSRINPNLKHHYRTDILNIYYQVLSSYDFRD